MIEAAFAAVLFGCGPGVLIGTLVALFISKPLGVLLGIGLCGLGLSICLDRGGR